MSDCTFDPNIFAVLTPTTPISIARTLLDLPQNSKWITADSSSVSPGPSRENTPADDAEEDASSARDCLVLSFDKLLTLDNLERGLRFGTDVKSSHIVLGARGRSGSISADHYTIMVDKKLHIWLYDCSQYGTAVSHNHQHQNTKQVKGSWIMAYEPGNKHNSVLEPTEIFCGKLGISVEFPNHKSLDPAYAQNLRAFVERCLADQRKQGAERDDGDPPGVAGIALQSPLSTRAPTTIAPTLSARNDIHYKAGSLGAGAFGKVYKMIRACDGLIFAAKVFHQFKKRKRGTVQEEWMLTLRKEHAIMKTCAHRHVIETLGFSMSPQPTIYMPYYPLGNILEAGITESSEYITAFGQVLDGLAFLHDKKLAHRDLKPENLLVQRSPLRIIIADFGLSKFAPDSFALQTRCGTPKYAAPEVLLSDRYGLPADIWSLGIIALEWLCSIPKYPLLPGRNAGNLPENWDSWVHAWTSRLLATLHRKRGSSAAIAILSAMIRFQAKERETARWCLVTGLQDGLFRRNLISGFVVCGDERPTIPDAGPSARLDASSVSFSSNSSASTIIPPSEG